MQKFKMPSIFLQEEEGEGEETSILPKFSKIYLDFVKEYLYVDFSEDDLLISLMIETAKEVVLTETECEDETELDEVRMASVVTMMIISDLYNSRTTTATDVKIKFNPLFSLMFQKIRGLKNGYRL